jgi:uncharacterized protein
MFVSILAAVCLAAVNAAGPGQSVRVVDSVDVSSARDEAAHALAGERTQLGESGGSKWRSATGWFGYSLKTYDDSPLTLVLVLAGGSGERETFDLLVDGKKVATLDRPAGSLKPEEKKVDVPFAQTKGKLSVAVRLQAHEGSRTARVLEMRTMQEHLE